MKLKTNILIQLIFCINFSFAQNKINELPKIEGLDATYFFKDNDKFWVGTGSSGGIYYSNNIKGKWKSKNKPFGFAHIYWIGKTNNKLYINADSNYYFLKNNKWNLVAKKDIEIIKATEIEDNSRNIKYFKKFFDHSKYSYLKSHANSIFQLNTDTLVICSKNGIYFFNNKDQLLTKYHKHEIFASDIYQIKQLKDRRILVLTNDKRVLLINKKQWVQIFSLEDYIKINQNWADDHIKQVNSSQSIHNQLSRVFPKGILVELGNNKLSYTVDNRIFIIDLITNELKEVFTQDGLNFEGVYYDHKSQSENYIANIHFKHNNEFIYFTKYALNTTFQILKTDSISTKQFLTIFGFEGESEIVYTTMSSEFQIKIESENISIPTNSFHLFSGFFITKLKNPKVLSMLVDDNSKIAYLGTSGSGLTILSLKKLSKYLKQQNEKK